jgi:hypothetical protein
VQDSGDPTPVAKDHKPRVRMIAEGIEANIPDGEPPEGTE